MISDIVVVFHCFYVLVYPVRNKFISYVNMNRTTNHTEEQLEKDRSTLYVNVVISACVLYVTVCQSVLFIMKRNNRSKSQNAQGNWLSIHLSLIMDLTLIFSGVMALSKMSFSVSGYFRWNSVLYTTDILLSIYSFITIYVLLWLRQTMFHTDPRFGDVSSSFLQILSKFQGCFVLLYAVILGILVVYVGVTNDVKNLEDFPLWILIVIIFLQAETQIVMLILFICPMVRYRRNLRSSFDQPPPNTLVRLMKRTVLSTVIAVVGDIFTLLLFYVTGIATFYNCNILINLTCVLFCFEDWRTRLILCFYKKTLSQNGQTVSNINAITNDGDTTINTVL
ncbi:uncharacterized protein LOC144422281 [Styela clava]